MLKNIALVFTIIMLTALSNPVLSGTLAGMGMGMGNPPCGVGNFPPCPAAVPIDGGILLLAGAGLTLGARKLLKKK